jgi:peptidylprolyl isomerase
LSSSKAARVRRSSLVVVVILVALTCGALSASPVAAASAPLSEVTVSTDTSAKPTLTFDKPFSVKKTTDDVVTKGTGAKLVKGQRLSLDYVLVDARTGAEVQTSWGATPAPLVLDSAKSDKQLVSSLTGLEVGSRLLVAIAPKDLAQRLNEPGVKKNDTLLYVIDVKDAITPLPKAEGEAVAPVAGLPAVKVAKSGKPTITVPSGNAAPTQLVVQPLIKGNGPAVQSGQTVSVHYTGVIWDSGKKFDSSWDRKSPFETVIGNQSVIAGWDEGIVGQTVGSQMLLVVPPDKGYGSAGQSNAGIKGTDTLVFVVDILDAY